MVSWEYATSQPLDPNSDDPRRRAEAEADTRNAPLFAGAIEIAPGVFEPPEPLRAPPHDCLVL